MYLSDNDLCELILKKHAGVVHPINVYHVKVLDLALESAIQLQKWPAARRYAELLLPGLRKYNGPFSPLVAVCLMKLGKMLLLLDEFQAAVKYLRDAQEIMRYTHGSANLSRTPLRALLAEAEAAVKHAAM